MISIIDYGVGNLKSLYNAFRHLDVPANLIRTADEVAAAEKLLLPGVGAFDYAMSNINRLGLVEVLQARAKEGVPVLGICLGMQLLFSHSTEGVGCQGLGLVQGTVTRFGQGKKVPHMGWNEIDVVHEGTLLRSLPESKYAYFVHSYHCVPEEKQDIAAFCDYGSPFCAVVARGNIFGTQFHPEKSQELGLQILENFGEI